jgi:hypothetical protein
MAAAKTLVKSAFVTKPAFRHFQPVQSWEQESLFHHIFYLSAKMKRLDYEARLPEPRPKPLS